LNKSILSDLTKLAKDHHATLVAVSKTHPVAAIQEVYDEGIRDFGENRVQELMDKAPLLPNDIHWHFIGHLQTNKVKYIAPFIHLIHSVDSARLAKTINQQALKNSRTIDILLQMHIAMEESKFGFSEQELMDFLEEGSWRQWNGIRIRGLMGMATFTDNQEKIRTEFKGLKDFFDRVKQIYFKNDIYFDTLSMGMSGDYHIALEEGSNMIRVGSLIFGQREYL
jgi:pyridoxal phosphate enzyme (YggS family)